MRPLQPLRADALGKGRKSGWTRSLALALTIAWFGACEDPVAVSCSFLSEPISDAPYLYACPEELGLDPSALEAVLAMVQGFVDDGSIVGGELMLVKNERIVLHEAVGWDDPVRGLGLDRNSIYRIRSMTKPFVGTSILLLVAEGLLDLGDSVRTYVPAFDNERSRDIIIRQLLTHTAGYVQGGWPSTFSHFSSLREAVDAVGQMGPHEPPGDGYVYSDKRRLQLGGHHGRGPHRSRAVPRR